MNTPFPLALLPVGSVNVLARELGIPFALPKAAQVAADLTIRRIDLGLANGQPFASNVGLGFDAEVVHSVRPEVKSVIGTAAYVADGMALLSRYRSPTFSIVADGESLVSDAWLAVITNVPRYTYWQLSPGASMDDGWLDLCLFHGESLGLRSRQVLAVLSERHYHLTGVQHVRARHFEFSCAPSVHVQLDGDPVGMTPVEVSVVPAALSVVVPG